MVIRGNRGRGRGGNRGAKIRQRDPNGRNTNVNGSGDMPKRHDSYGEPVEKLQNNPALEAYYIDQQILPMEEWESFMNHIKAPLPTSFRITSGKATTPVLLDQMKNYYLPFLSNVIYEGEKVPPPQSLRWYPEGLGWQIDVKKNALRKTEEFKKFQHFLVHETEVGNISRQESVSMIPPLFLDVQPHHIVLDMCAAPGSKTAQLIEAIHSPLTAAADAYDPCPLGIVVANDSDAKRAHMLIHQSQRLPSPNLVVANYDAAHWPTIKVPYIAKEGSDTIEEKVMLYDRVLTDVPCSGDGTIRKNLMVWKDWHPFNGASLHTLQLQILMRGLANLRNGGRLVYSTCSMNPTENEAVVAAAIRQCKGTVKILDQSGFLPELKRRKGMTKWKVLATRGKTNLNKKGNIKSHADDAEGVTRVDTTMNYREKLPQIPYTESWEDLEASMKDKVPITLWPAGDEEGNHLERCMRIYPHDQNTGGFFVAVLEKKIEGVEVIERGMAEGMVRVMNKLDHLDDVERAQRKRAPSPSSDNISSSPIKKLKMNGVDQQENGIETPEDTTTSTREILAPNTVNTSNEVNVIMAGGTPFREDPMAYVDLDDDQSKTLVSFFNFDKGFNPRNFLVRNKEARPIRSVYITSTSVRALISSGGTGRGPHPYGNPLKMRLLNCGIRALQKQDAGKDARLQCKWRVMSDGIPALRPFVKEERIIMATLDDFAFLLRNHYPKTDDVPMGKFRDQIIDLEMGSHFVDVKAGTWKGGHILKNDLCVPIWRAAASLNLMLDRQEKSALSFRIFGSDLSSATGERQFASDNVKQKQILQKDQSKEAIMNLDEDQLQELENAAASSLSALNPDDIATIDN